MQTTFADIGKTRLEKVLFKEKANHPAKVCEVVKSDLKGLMNNYAEVDKDISVDIDTDEDGFIFNISVHASRLKTFGSLPDIL